MHILHTPVHYTVTGKPHGIWSSDYLPQAGGWFPPGTPVSSPRKLISSSSFHRLDMTLAVAEALNPNKRNQTVHVLYALRTCCVRVHCAYSPPSLYCPRYYTTLAYRQVNKCPGISQYNLPSGTLAYCHPTGVSPSPNVLEHILISRESLWTLVGFSQ